jgi:phosphoglycolate phosphatase-like HAD superfamily hydrolase
LYQYQGKIKTVDVEGEPVQYIEVTLEDIEKANTLANEVQGQSLDELAKPSRTLLSAIYRTVKKIADIRNAGIDEIFFTRRMIREYTGWSDWGVSEFETVTYVGDGVWDLKASRNMGYHFMGIAFYNNEAQLRQEGASRILTDYRDQTAFFFKMDTIWAA